MKEVWKQAVKANLPWTEGGEDRWKNVPLLTEYLEHEDSSVYHKSKKT